MKSITTIRPATPDDIPVVVELATRFIRETRYAAIVQAVPAQLELVAGWLLEHGVILLAERDKLVIGMLALAALPHPLTGETYVDEIAWWVDLEYRNTPAGYRLLYAAEDWTRQSGHKVLKMLSPSGSNVRAIYERRGYEEVETVFRKSF